MKRILSVLLVLTFAFVPTAYAQDPPPVPPLLPAPPGPSGAAPPPADPQVRPGFSQLAERLLPAVVNISTTQTIKDKDTQGFQDFPQFPPGSPFEDFFKDFMDKHKQIPNMPKQRKTTSLGSGFIIDPSGYVVTNNHVIQDADEITVILHDDTNLKAKVLGRDPKTDIALMKIESKKPLPAVQFGNSDTMKVGDWILVIGNPFGLGGTVTSGIISARARDINSGPYDDYIQTDASINRGNSGGPMFNLDGEVIGICTAIFSPSGGSVGIGFAIPSALAHNVIDQLKANGKIRRGWLGVRIQNVTEEIAKSLNLPAAEGALVSSVTKGSPAEKAGLEAGDVIRTLDGKPIKEMRQLPRMVAESRIKSDVELGITRAGKDIKKKVNIGEMAEEENEAEGGGTTDEGTPKGIGHILNIPEFDVKVAPLTDAARKSYEIDEGVKGIVITSIGDNSNFVDKGLKPGDVIVEAGQKEIKDVKDFAALAKETKTGNKPLLMLIDRGGDLRFVAVNAIDEKAKKEEKKDAKPAEGGKKDEKK